MKHSGSTRAPLRLFGLVLCGLLAGLAAAPAAASIITGAQNFEIVARLTGSAGSSSINPTWQVGVQGTDLGHMVNHNGKTYFLFGDTFNAEGSGGSGGPDWRNNVMAYSTDATPADGITFDGWITRPNGTARQVINPGTQPVTYIPTGAISVGDNIYAWYMHVSDWNGWTLSHAGLGRWREGDSQFTIVPNYRFENPAGGAYTTGNGTAGGNFGMVAASYRSPAENSGDPYIYVWGTPGGREGGVKLARVLPEQIENLSTYRYYDGLAGGEPQWVASEYAAEEIVPAGVGEMSVMYNEAVGAWTLMYMTGGPQPDFEIRQAQNPWGPWSNPVRVVDFSQAPGGMYAPYMNPLYVEDGGRTVYFTMSLWHPYDVYLAKATLELSPRSRWLAAVGTWSNALNWNPGVPAADAHVILDNGGVANITTAEAVRRIDVGTGAGLGGRIVASVGGALTVGNAIRLGQAAGGDGELIVQGGAIEAGLDNPSRLLAGLIVGESGRGDVRVEAGQLALPGRLQMAQTSGASGAMTVLGGAVSVGGDLIVAGQGDGVLHQSGGTIEVGGTLHVSTGEVHLDGGVLAARKVRHASGGLFDFGGGTLRVGSFEGSLTNAGGTLASGAPLAAATITGDYTQLAGATLSLELGGTVLGAQYDALAVTGAAALAGGLNVTLTDDFTPSAGDFFQIIAAGGSVSGSFASLALPVLESDLRWKIDYEGAAVRLGVLATADFDEDGDVDGDDLVQWQSNFGDNAFSDADNDGDSDGADFLAWQRQLGSGPALAASAAVPEPGGFMLGLLAAAIGCLYRRPASDALEKRTSLFRFRWRAWAAPLVLLLVAPLALPALAVTRSWDGGGAADNSWTTDANWSSDTQPDVDDAAQFERGAALNYTVELSLLRFGGDIAVDRLLVGPNTVTFRPDRWDTGLSVVNATIGSMGRDPRSTGLAQLMLAAGAKLDVQQVLSVGDRNPGSLLIHSASDAFCSTGLIGATADAPGEVAVSGATSSWYVGGQLVVGAAGLGSLTISDGGVVSGAPNVSPFAFDKLGSAPGVVGTVTATGDGSALYWGGSMHVGHQGHGRLVVTDGAAASPNASNAAVGGLRIGSEVGSTGEVLVAGEGSSLYGGLTLSVGSFGAGHLAIEAGADVSASNFRIASAAGGSGEVVLDGPGSTLSSIVDFTIGGGNTAVGGTGSLTVSNGASVSHTGANLPDIIVWNTSSILLDGGSIAAPGLIVHGTLSGHGTITADVSNDGHVLPGASTGVLQIDGQYAQQPSGRLALEIGGPEPGGQYDQLQVAQAGVLAGTLEIELVDGFLPSVGQNFTLLTADEIVGAFSLESLPSVPGVVFDVIYNPQSVVLAVLPDFTADFNDDGDVDGDDLVQWRSDFGENAFSDADDDGDSDGADFLAWQRQLAVGVPLSGEAAVVPEPAALRVTAILAAWLIMRRRLAI